MRTEAQRRRVGLGVLAAVLLAGCATVLGVEDVDYVDAGGPAEDGGSADSSAVDGSRDGARCVPENCLDGIDNDCNGKIDCQDEACAAFACAAAVPAGWQPAALTLTLDAGCAPAFAQAGAFNEGPADPIACSCSCAADPGECRGWLVQSTSPGCSNPLTPQPPNGPIFMHADGGCADRFMTIPPNTYMQILDAAPVTDTCTSTTIAKPRSVTFAASGTACLAPSAGGGCQPSQPSCVPASAKPFAACIGHAGDVPCPDGGAWTRHVTGARDGDGGSAIASDAGCSACACTPMSTCTSPSVGLNGNTCSGGPIRKATVTDLCVIPGTTSADSYEFTAVRNAACAPGGSTPTGRVTLAAPTTICCPP